MALNLSTGVCTIYMGARADKATINHEYSHCMGWHHTWDNQKQRYEWFPMPEVRKYDFSASGKATKRGGASAGKERQ